MKAGEPKKDVKPRLRQRDRGETKTSNLTTKILPGSVERRRVKCGKSNCKCRRGEPHGFYYYHVTTDENTRTRRYIRHADVAEVMQACENHRQLQAQLRAGRQQYKALLSHARALFGSI
jgi:hypothetical protein